MAELNEPIAKGRWLYTTTDGAWEIHHLDGSGTEWGAYHIPTRWRLLEGFGSLPDLRGSILTGGIWPSLLWDARRVLDLPDRPASRTGDTSHDHARTVLAWIAEHAPHCMAQGTTACDCGGELAFVAGSWGHTGLVVCASPEVTRCGCPHRRSGYTCDEPVRLDVRCATLKRRRACCGGCWKEEVPCLPS